MVRQRNWYNPAVIRRVRTRISIVLWIILGVLFYLNYGWIAKLLSNIYHQF
jgi:O-methyltransferase involved in polyketide biosynthesis